MKEKNTSYKKNEDLEKVDSSLQDQEIKAEVLDEATEEKDMNMESHEKEKEKEKEKEEEKEEGETLETLKSLLEVSNEKLLRALADNENTRKQMEKVRQESNKYGIQPLAREILNVVDNFDRALSLKNENNNNTLAEGVTLIQKEILSILEKFNIKKIDALGEEFNANYHQAMFEKETSDYEEGKVCEIVQEGYEFHDRLLRPVLVGVAKKKKDLEENNEEK